MLTIRLDRSIKALFPLRRGRFWTQILFWGALAFFAFVFINAGSGQRYPWVNHDVAGGLAAGEKLASGARLYVDWIDNNPPAYYLYCAFVVTLSRGIHLPAVTTYHLSILLLAATGLLLLQRVFPPRQSAQDPYILTGAAYLLAAILANFEGYDFGQREHIFALLFIPYIFWRVMDGRRTTLILLYLLLLGWFASMKPDFLVLVLLTEFYCGMSNRSRPGDWLLEAGVIIAGFTLPYVLLCLHSLESMRQFLGFLMPYHLLGGHDAYFEGGGQLKQWWFSQNPAAAILAFAGVSALCFVWLHRLHPTKYSILGILLMIGAALSIQMQHKYWSYHFALFFAMMLVFDAFLLHKLVAHYFRFPKERLAGGILLLGFCCWLLGPRFLDQIGRFSGKQVTLVNVLKPALAKVPPRGKVLFLSPSNDFNYPLIFCSIRSAGPWAFNFTLPAIVRLPSQTERNRVLKRYVDNLREVIRKEQPRLLIFSPSMQALNGKTIHQILVEENGLLSNNDYRIWRSCAVAADFKGWIVYEPVLHRPECP